MTKVFIDGSEGTTGLRIHERFSVRDDISLIQIDPEKRKDPSARAECINSSDITFLCLPDGAARESVSLVTDPNVRVIDTSTAHRTSKDWSYGFAELSDAHRRAIADGERIAVPGCHASGFISLVYPMIKSGFLPEDALLTCFSLTGYSGGGKKMIAQYESDDRENELDAPRQYGLTQNHKHLPEMQAVTGLKNAPVFCPTVADFYSGMQVTVPVFSSQLSKKLSVDDIRGMFADHYSKSRLVRVTDTSDMTMLPSNDLSGYDGMEIAVFGNDERILLTSRFDNLGKGASGAAVQCMNIMLGIDETAGLSV